MSTQQHLSDEQEAIRLEGLRRLARIIARHYLAHPEKYASGGAGGQGDPPHGGEGHIREQPHEGAP